LKSIINKASTRISLIDSKLYEKYLNSELDSFICYRRQYKRVNVSKC